MTKVVALIKGWKFTSRKTIIRQLERERKEKGPPLFGKQAGPKVQKKSESSLVCVGGKRRLSPWTTVEASRQFLEKKGERADEAKAEGEGLTQGVTL